MGRTALCACGRLRVTVDREPVLVATCHCDYCQKRTGSAFALIAAFPPDEVLEIEGEVSTFNGLEQDGVGPAAGGSVTYRFCPTCGSTLWWTSEGDRPLLAMAVGNFVEPDFPPPTIELNVALRHGWVPPVPGADQFDGAR